MGKYVPDSNFGSFDGQGRPKNPKGLFVVPTGSASVLTVSSSLKGGSIGSTKDTLQLLSNLEDGGEYEEPWHESVHYLDKRVTEISNGVNKLADSQSNLSGSSASSIATNKAKSPLVIGTRSTEAKAGNTTTISTTQANAISAALTISNKTEGQLTLTISDNNLQIRSVVGKTVRTYLIPPQ